MATFHESFEIETEAGPAFHDVTERVKKIVSRSSIRDGLAVVYSQHTTCSVMIQEESHDTTYYGIQYLFQDLLDILESLIPRCRKEGQYLHPGPEHIEYVVESLGELPIWSLNTDAHLRSCIFGRSESIPIIDGDLQLGEFGRVFFVDFDSVRARKRVARVQVLGE
jgi:thiamine phosphate synthase YjbQ (UPF0047 family)